MYFVITTNAINGRPSLSVIGREKLLEAINPDEDGYSEIRPEDVHTNIDSSVDLPARVGIYIIKGNLVAPRPKKVESFDID